VWGRDDYGVGCTGEAAYALDSKELGADDRHVGERIWISNETELQANVAHSQGRRAPQGQRGADRRTTTTKFHIGLESVVVRSGGLDIYSQLVWWRAAPALGHANCSSTSRWRRFWPSVRCSFAATRCSPSSLALSHTGAITTTHPIGTSIWTASRRASSLRTTCPARRAAASTPPRIHGPILTTFSTNNHTHCSPTTTHAATGRQPTRRASRRSSLSKTRIGHSACARYRNCDCHRCSCRCCVRALHHGWRHLHSSPTRQRPQAVKVHARHQRQDRASQGNAARVRTMHSRARFRLPNRRPTRRRRRASRRRPAESPRPVRAAASDDDGCGKVGRVAHAAREAEPHRHRQLSRFASRAICAALASPNGAPAGVIFVERGYEVPYSFDSDSQQVYMGQHGIAADFTPAVGREAHANMALDRHVRDQYASPAKQNQVLDDIF
jgi:hypothetical protein